MMLPPWEITPDLVLSKDERVVKEQVANLNLMLRTVFNYLSHIRAAGGVPTTEILDFPFLLHGDTVPEALTDGALHRDMTGADLHWPKIHADRHMNDIDPLPLMPGLTIFPGDAMAPAHRYLAPIMRTTTFQGVALCAVHGPTGADLTTDITLNGVEQTRVATLADGMSKQYTAITPITFSAGEWPGVKILSVGSTDPGYDLHVYLVP
jgi:hypothetical protein